MNETNEEIPEEGTPATGCGSPLYQVRQDDLAELERLIPSLCERFTTEVSNDRRVRAQLRKVKQILSDIRWDRVIAVNAQGDIQEIPNE